MKEGMISEAKRWAELWQEAAEQSEYAGFFEDVSSCWNQSASFYDRELGSDRRRVDTVLEIFRRQGLLGQEGRVLDIGSGTGSYALPFARICREVTAWDSSEEMNRILRKKMEQEGVANIRICQADFSENCLPRQSYDLVFGSLNPALYSPGALNRMMEFSRKACAYIGMAETREQAGEGGEETLNHLLLGTNLSHHGSNDSIYPFRYLSALGLQPERYDIPCSWESRERGEDACRRLVQYYSGFPKIRPDFRQKIEEYVDAHLIQGWLIQKVDARLGMVVWKIDAD